MTERKYFDEDAELADRARRGDRDAFGVLVEKFQGPIYSYTLHFFRNATHAEDVTQETFLRAFRFLHTYDHSRRFSTWLYTVARNLCIDWHRGRVRTEHADMESIHPRHLVAAQAHLNPLERLEDREDRVRLLWAVRQLPEKYRTPIILCYMQGLPYQEISEIINISLNNTKIRIFRAKKMILKLLGMSEDGE